MTVTALNHLRCYGRAMVRLICNFKKTKLVQTYSVLLSRLDIQNVIVVLCTSGIRFLGHVERSDGSIAQACKLHRRDDAGQRNLR